ncbi:hypothetical protein ACOME3_004470 [Neoechinorhynchus agilis]
MILFSRIAVVLLLLLSVSTSFQWTNNRIQWLQNGFREFRPVEEQQYNAVFYQGAKSPVKIIGNRPRPRLHRLFGDPSIQFAIFEAPHVEGDVEPFLTELSSDSKNVDEQAKATHTEHDTPKKEIIEILIEALKNIRDNHNWTVATEVSSEGQASIDAFTSPEEYYEPNVEDLTSQCGYENRIQVLSDLLRLEELRYLAYLKSHVTDTQRQHI